MMVSLLYLQFGTCCCVRRAQAPFAMQFQLEDFGRNFSDFIHIEKKKVFSTTFIIIQIQLKKMYLHFILFFCAQQFTMPARNKVQSPSEIRFSLSQHFCYIERERAISLFAIALVHFSC